MAEALKTIAEDAGLQAPDTVVGAAFKVPLGYSHTEKDEIALISARSILNSHNRRIGNSEAAVADICDKIMKEVDSH